MCFFLLDNCFVEITLGDYHLSRFKLNTRASTDVSTTNLNAPQTLNLQDYEHVLSKLFNKKKTGGKERELGGSRDERNRARLYVEGEGGIDSDTGEARNAAIGKRKEKEKEKARFHSLLSVVDWDGVQVEKKLERDVDRDWEEGRRKALFDAKR